VLNGPGPIDKSFINLLYVAATLGLDGNEIYDVRRLEGKEVAST
jgi:hypothetical protein